MSSKEAYPISLGKFWCLKLSTRRVSQVSAWPGRQPYLPLVPGGPFHDTVTEYCRLIGS